MNYFLWFKNNLSHIFSIVGIALTIYFSVYYVPQYSEEIRLKKIEGVNKELISTIQELIYNGNKIDQHEIETLIKGKELKENMKYPYSVNELLIQVQETFISNRFIPLDARTKFVRSVDQLRSEVKLPLGEAEVNKQKNKGYEWSSIIFAIIGLFFSVLGTISVINASKRQREEEIQEQVTERKDEFQSNIRKALFLEELVQKKLIEIYGKQNVKCQGPADKGIDFLVTKDNTTIFGVEVKFTDMGLVPLRVINELGEISKSVNYPVVLITNAPLTKNAGIKFEKLNRELKGSKIIVLTVDEIDKINSELATRNEKTD